MTPLRRSSVAPGVHTGYPTVGSLSYSSWRISKHLTVLDRVGLVTGRRTGRETRYSVNLERFDQATTSLGQLAADWDRRLARIKQIAEAAHARTKKPA